MKHISMLTRRKILASSITGGLTTAVSGKTIDLPASWQSGPPLPIPIQEIYPTVHRGKLYVAGGIAARLGAPYFTDKCFAYDPSTAIWQNLPDLPEALHHAALVSNGDRLFCCGGFNGGYTHIWKMRDAVYELTDSGWQAVGTMPKPMAEGVIATGADGLIHCVTGQSPIGEPNSARSDHREITDHWTWHPASDKWQQRAAIPTPRNSATGGWLNGMLVITGGRTTAGNLDITEIYNPANDSWHQAASLPKPQAGTASVVTNSGLIVFGGEIFQPDAAVFANVWRYDLAADQWSALPDLPTPRHGLGAGLIGDKIYVIGGATQPSGRGTSVINDILINFE